jgi:hypothetical protein
MFRHVGVGNLDRGDAWDALALPLTAAGRSFSLDVVADIVEATAGYPYFLQFFGAYLCRSVATADVSVGDYRAPEPALIRWLSGWGSWGPCSTSWRRLGACSGTRWASSWLRSPCRRWSWRFG